MQPFYDPARTYEDNYRNGPFGVLSKAPGAPDTTDNAPGEQLLGHAVTTTFGIPAGPLLNARFVTAAFRHGFDLCTYKTVRSRARSALAFPNVLDINSDGDLRPDQMVHAASIDPQSDMHPMSISNSFGVPSQDPDVWQPDMARAVRAARAGQLMIGSFQGTGAGDEQIRDYAATARLVSETGAPVLEANLSCPNEGKSGLLCFDIARVSTIVDIIRDSVPELPLLLKLAHFTDDAQLEKLVTTVGPRVAGFCAINTLPARVMDASGRPALPGRRVSGICGRSIRWAGLDMTRRLRALRRRHGQTFAIIANGGVLDAADDDAYRRAGADAVMSATGAMWQPRLGRQIRAAHQGRRRNAPIGSRPQGQAIP